MESQVPIPPAPLRWRDALRRILALLEGLPGGDTWAPAEEEVRMLQMGGFGPLLSDVLVGHPAFPALFAEEVLNGRRIEAHRRVLAELAGRLEGKISPPILFKGIAACDELYDKPSLRVFTDVDLLIRSADLPAWEEAIQSLGGRCGDAGVFVKRGFSARHYFEHAYRLPTEDPDLHVELDLHRSFGPPQCYPMDYDSVAPECRPSEHGPYLILEPGQWICALAIHQVRALFVWSYQDYVDLFQILRKWPVDDNALLEQAGRFGARKASSILLRNLRMAIPEGSAVRVPRLDDLLPACHEEFREQMRLPVASRPLKDPSFLRNTQRTARLSDSWPSLVRYAVAYLAKRGADLVTR
jgi:hypothetical protein